MNEENVIMCSLWFGPSKLPTKALLDPVVKNLDRLATVGITLSTPSGIKTIRGKLVLGIFDMPAKAAVLNMKQFNGAYGCPTCLHPGLHQNGARIYLPQEVNQRTNVDVLQNAARAEMSGIPVFGIKGYSTLAPTIDLVDSIPVDYMHAVLEGVTRWLLHRWFDSKHHAEAYYLGPNLKSIDLALIKQCPPHEVSRSPRSIEAHLSYWKASELRSWLLYYSLPLVLHHLPSLYFHHFALLVNAIHIFLQDSLTERLICAAEQMIVDFLAMLPELYGNKSCTANSHALSHIAKYVRLWGPLWTHSAFGFESKNGHLKNMFHAKSSVTDQLVFAADVAQTLNLVQATLERRECEATLNFIARTTGHASRTNMKKISEDMYSIGKTRMLTLSDVESALMKQVSAEGFGRAFCNGTLYYSQEHTKGQGKRDSTICRFCDNEHIRKFGEIQKFVLAREPVAIILEFEPYCKSILQQAGAPCRQILKVYADVDIMSDYIHAVKPHPNKTVIIPLKNLVGKAVLITPAMSDCIFLIQQPNNFEHH